MSIRNSSSDHFQDSEHVHINIGTINASPQDSFLGQGPEHDDGEIFGVILSRRYEKQQSSIFDNVVRKTMSMRAEEQTPSLGFESAVRRAFSMRATTSTSAAVSETYCRIDNEDDEENLLTAAKAQAEAQNESSNNNTKKRNKFFEICKRVFGF